VRGRLLQPTCFFRQPATSLDLAAKYKRHRNSQTFQILGDLEAPAQMTVEYSRPQEQYEAYKEGRGPPQGSMLQVVSFAQFPFHQGH